MSTQSYSVQENRAAVLSGNIQECLSKGAANIVAFGAGMLPTRGTASDAGLTSNSGSTAALEGFATGSPAASAAAAGGSMTNFGGIAGGVVGGVLCAIALVLLGWFLARRCGHHRAHHNPPDEDFVVDEDLP